MPTKIDILIHSLIRGDNDPNGSDWAAAFSKYLNTILTKLLGGPAQIELSSSLSEGNELSEAILDKVKVVVVLDAVQSESDPEAVDFLRFLANWQHFSNRVFKVRKSWSSENEGCEELKGLISFDLDVEDDKSVLSEHFWMKLVDLAYEIKRQLQAEDSDDVSTSTVYLALTSPEQAPIRDVIYRELRRHGYQVLPNRALPKENDALETAIEEYLKKSILSIHIIGENAIDRDSIISGDEEVATVVDIQNTVASRYCDRHNDKFQRLIWFSPELGMDSEEQLLYIERLKRDTKALIGAELIQTPLEKLKSIIKRRLKLIAEGHLQDNEVVSNSDKLKVYLICDKEDEDKSKMLRGWLEDHGYEVLLPSFDGKQLSLLHSHRRNLAVCDAALIYHGHQNARWVQMKMLDLLKAPGYGRTKPMLAQGLFLAEKDLKVKPNAQLKNLTVLDPGELSQDQLGPFFKKLNKDG